MEVHTNSHTKDIEFVNNAMDKVEKMLKNVQNVMEKEWFKKWYNQAQACISKCKINAQTVMDKEKYLIQKINAKPAKAKKYFKNKN